MEPARLRLCLWGGHLRFLCGRCFGGPNFAAADRRVDGGGKKHGANRCDYSAGPELDLFVGAPPSLLASALDHDHAPDPGRIPQLKSPQISEDQE